MKPTIKHFVTTFLPYGILLIAVFSILPHILGKFAVLSRLNVTTVWWIILFFILMLFYISNKYFLDKENKKELVVVNIYLLWMVICIVRGAFVAELYWDWKGLVFNSMGLLLPVVAYSATNKVIVQSILSIYIKYGLPLFVLLMLLIRTDAYGFFLIPISFLLLFLPALSNRQRGLLLLSTVVIFIADLGARSSVLKFGVPVIILILYYLRGIVSIKFLESIRLAFMVIPFVLFSLAATDVFNVFNMSDYIGEIKSSGANYEGDRELVDLSSDTRTFLYVEVIHSAINNDYWIFGRTPARGNDSPSFGPFAYELTGRDERLTNEVGILNVFTWTGIIGVVLYLLVFYRASYLAINRSKNIFAKMLGIYISFRWIFSWVEDVNNFTLNYFMFWIMIGLCFSRSFRMMSDYEVTIWIRGVFDKRYLNFEENLKKEEDGK